MKWEKVKLGELYEVHNGLSKAGKFFGEGYPFLTFSTVFNNYFIPKQITDLVQSTEKEQESYSIRRGDVFVTRTSETSDELGMSCVALKDYPMATYNGFTKRMRPITNRVFPEYIGYYMRLPSFRGEFRAFSTMTTRASLRNEDLLGMEVKLPPIEIQKQIAGILSVYDDLIENNQKQIKLLEEAAQRLYKEWFVDLRFPGHENTKIVDGVPEGWSKSMVSEVSAVLRRGISPKYNEKARGIVINQKCIRQTIVSYDEARTQEKKYPAELEMMESDIVICSTGAGTLGRVGQIFEAKGNATLDSHVTLIRANEKIGQQSLFWSLKMKQDYLMNAGKGSTNQLELSRETIGSCEILIPERKIAEQVEKNFVAIHNKMKECSMQIARLREVRDLLLPKLMSGEMEV